MATKKCPKCGEDNPAEAVMCWACYTPLSGSAPLGAGLAGGVATAGAMPKTAGAPIGIPQTDAPAKKGIDPKAIAVGAFLLLGVAAAIFMSGALGGGGDTAIAEAGTDPTPMPFDSGSSSRPTQPVGGVAPPTIGGGGGGGAPPAPVPLPFTTIATPGAGFKTGTLGILVSGNASLAGAAKFAKDQFARTGGWTNMQVAVFTDKATADNFSKYQNSKKNAPLTAADFQNLASAGVWTNTPVFLDSRGKQEKIYYPSQKATSWWPNR